MGWRKTPRVWRWMLPMPVLFMVTLAVVYGYRARITARSNAQLEATIAQITADDPTWTFETNEAARPIIPDDENLLVQLTRHAKAFKRRPDGRDEKPDTALNLHDVPPNHRLTEKNVLRVEHELDGMNAARPVSRWLVKFPRGRWYYSSTLSKDGYLERLGDGVPFYDSQFWKYEGHRLIEANRGQEAITYVRLQLYWARLFQDDVGTSGYDSRVWDMQGPLRAVERLLAQSTTPLDLTVLQREFEQECQYDYERDYLRSLRAEGLLRHQALESGRVSLANTIELAGSTGWCATTSGSLEAKAIAWRFRPYLAADTAASLDYLTRLIATTKLPMHQREAAMLAEVPPPLDDEHLLAGHIGGIYGREVQLSQRLAALVRCTLVAIAVERFRQATGDWPKDLADVSPNYLRELPMDPFTGEALRYLKRPDGVTIYSLGHDRIDNRGDVEQFSPKKLDIGVRLYNLDQRRLPPLPDPPDERQRLYEPKVQVSYGPMPRVVEAGP